jgi:radical SAM superfamily enzyme YgiQ (UPF0313 family)
MRVLLISANTFRHPHPVYPLGLDYVADSLAPAHQVRILDTNTVQGTEEVTKAVQGFSPEAVGISLRNIDNANVYRPEYFFDHVRDVVRVVRENTDAPVILGGSGFTLFPQALLERLDADYGILGEGERMASLLEALETGASVHLPGVVGPDFVCPIPPPWEETVTRQGPSASAHVAFYLNKSGILNLQSKRGCPFRCIYCTYPLIEGNQLRLFDPREVGKTARELQDAGAKFLFVTDSVVNAHEEHSIEVALSMKAAGVTVPWGGSFSPRIRDADYFRKLADCGCTHVEFGTESLSESTLEAYRKPFGVEDIFRAHTQSLEAGLHGAHYMLFGGPGETEETMTQTLQNMEQLDRTVFFIYCGMRMFPGTPLFSLAVEQDVVRWDEDLLFPVFYTSPALKGKQIETLVDEHAGGRANWITPGLGERIFRVTERMYALGHTGPLWERLIR